METPTAAVWRGSSGGATVYAARASQGGGRVWVETEEVGGGIVEHAGAGSPGLARAAEKMEGRFGEISAGYELGLEGIGSHLIEGHGPGRAGPTVARFHASATYTF